MTLYFDKLIDRYIPTDSGWNFHPDNTALLPSTEIDGKLVIEATNPLSTDYKQLMYSNVSSGGNATVYYLDMITSKDSGALPKIVKDPAASNARAIELSPETTMIFRTNYPYNKDRLKKVLCRCRKEAGAPTLHVGVIGIEDKAYKQPDGTYGNNDFYDVTVSGNITESYVTYVGYIAGTDTVENIELVSRPNNDPDYPAKLLDGTTDIALMIRTGSGTGSIYIDSIELQDTENALTELPRGAMVVNSLEGLTDDNKLSPVEKAYVKTLLAEIDSEYDSVLADGTAAGVDSTLLTALTTKYTALRAIVVPLLEDMTKASNITSAFDDAFSEYYDAKTAVQSMTSNLNSAALSLSADTGVILISARGLLITEKIQLTIVSDRIPIGAITIARSDAGALIKVDDYHYILDCSTVLLDDITINVSATYLGKSYSSTVSVTKYVDPNKTVYNFGGVTIVPSKLPDGAGLAEGDYFLWSDENVATHEDVIPEPGKDALIKGEIYEYNGTKWVKSSNGDLVMTLFDSFADLENDVDSTVIGNAVIKKLATIEAFIGKLFTNKIELSEKGAIYSGYSADGVTPPPSGAGFWLGASGLFKAYFAELLGTLRTGRNAPTDARVAIQDETGIISGPTFTGTGLNDMSIMKAGDVAGDFRVKISGINNATDSGKEGYWATPFQVGTDWWYGVAVNSSGRFVAVGSVGYVSYSDDGITWATPFKVGTNTWYSIAVNSSGRFVAVGTLGYVSYSDDGITWATPFKVGTRLWYRVAVNSSGRFVAVGDYGYISYSNDGITWVTPFQVGTYDWRAIAVNSSGRFVAGGEYGYISYSNDGITWVTPFKVGNYTWYSMAVNSSGRFVAGGEYGYISYSNDGITWATPFLVGTYYWRGVAVNSASRFVAVGTTGYVSYSDDGITWATPFQVGTSTWYSIAVNSSGRFVAVGFGGHITRSLLQDTIQTSSNGGTTWGSAIPIPSGEAISLTGFGIDILFGHVEGHTVGDYWSFTQGVMRGLAIKDSAGSEYFSAFNGVVTLKTLNATTVDAPTVNATTVDATTVNATTVYGARFN